MEIGQVIECLSGIRYQDFISEIKEYAKDEDPFIIIVDIDSAKEYVSGKC